MPVKWIDRVLEIALERQPQPLPEETAAAAVAAPVPPGGSDVVTH
jgi:ATP-dependent Lon protease